MHLPNAEKAHLAYSKLHDYILNPNHSKGRHKAYAIDQATGIRREDAEFLRQQILERIRDAQITERQHTDFGIRYIVVIDITGPHGTLTVQTGWLVQEGCHVPRFTSLVPRRPRSEKRRG